VSKTQGEKSATDYKGGVRGQKSAWLASKKGGESQVGKEYRDKMVREKSDREGVAGLISELFVYTEAGEMKGRRSVHRDGARIRASKKNLG